MKKKKGEILVVAAPSGTGKTTIVKRILKEFPQIIFSISATTRKKRNNETHGVDYYFISEKEFKQKIERNEFAESERFYDYYYGTLKRFIDENIEAGKSVLLEVDVNGALSIKKNYPEAHLIFIVPPSAKELVKRLMARNTENQTDLKKRIERAKMELSIKDKFDYFVDNSDLEKAVEQTRILINNILNKE
ncbi:MAG: guanylate kinase [Ignavibacteriaceae bacterium]